jgi:hypothetical protein
MIKDEAPISTSNNVKSVWYQSCQRETCNIDTSRQSQNDAIETMSVNNVEKVTYSIIM